MRASATSRISTHTTHAVQANPAAKSDIKSDEATPFALLLQSVAPKGGKTDKSDSDKSDNNAADAAQDKSAAPDSTAQAAVSSQSAAKPAKPGKDDTDTTQANTDSDAPQDAGAVPADANTQIAVNDPTNPAAIAVPVAPAPAAAPQDTGSDKTAPVGQVAGAAATNPTPSAPAADTGKPQPADDDAAEETDAKQSDTKAADAKPDAVKSADAKPVARKGVAPDARPDLKPQAANDDDAKSTAPAVAVAVADSTAPKPVPAPAQATPQTDLAVAAPSAPTTAAAPTITQHVQVTTAAAKPDLPALAVEIAARTQSGAKQFDIRLDPPELGRVEVRLSIDATGKASAHLSADHPQTLELLQKDSSSLTRALRDAGLNVAQDGLNFSLRQQSQQGQQSGEDQSGFRQQGRGGFVATVTPDANTATASYRSTADGRLDIRV